MTNDINITVIIPLHVYDNEIRAMLSKAFESVLAQTYDKNLIEILFVVKEGLEEHIKNFLVSEKNNMAKAGMGENVSIIVQDGPTDFASQVNLGVKNAKTKYFTILEFDDEFYRNWFNNAAKQFSFDPMIDVCIPINDYRNAESGELISYGNELVWANAFSNELGVIDKECIETGFDFNLTGAIFSKEDFIQIGGLKPSIQMAFWYEYMLRAANIGQKLYVVPKLGYVHTLKRKGSLMVTYSEKFSEKEANAWFALAKQECLYKEDRGKTPVINLEDKEVDKNGK